jgi:hypothetical protein
MGEDARSASMSNLYALWSIQESLLQNYRMIFITAEAIFLSFAATVTASPLPWLALVIAIPGIVLLLMWMSITRARAQHVSFVQDMIRAAEKGNLPSQPLTQFKAIQDRAEGVAIADVSLRSHRTRRQLEIWLPQVFALTWLLLLICAMYLSFVASASSR